MGPGPGLVGPQDQDDRGRGGWLEEDHDRCAKGDGGGLHDWWTVRSASRAGRGEGGIHRHCVVAAKGTEFEFLVKEQPPSDWSPGTGWLTGASAGAPVEVSQTMGSGFLKTDDALEGVEDVILFAAGSGISPLRATIESGALKDKSVKLYYGCQTPDMMSYSDKFDEWSKLGVDVTPVVSKPDGTGWEGVTGYVQDAAKKDGVDNPKNTAILLCGMKGMAEAVKDFAAEAGIPEDKVLTNF